MSVSKISSHLSDSISRLLYQFRGKAGIESLVSVQSKQIQQIEDSAYDFLIKLPIQTATGAVLDRWGIVLNETRNGDSDADFRARLFFKISRNISNGTPEELIQFYAKLLQASNVQITEVFPGQIWLTAVGATNPANAVAVKSQMQQLAPAGVKIGLLVAGFSPHPFAFAAHPNSNARGFDTYPVAETGGVFVSVLA